MKIFWLKIFWLYDFIDFEKFFNFENLFRLSIFFFGTFLTGKFFRLWIYFLLFFFIMKYFLTMKFFLTLKFFYSKNSSDWILRKYTDWKKINFEIFFQLWAFFDSEKCFRRKCFRHWKIWIFHVITFSNSLIRCCIFQQCFSFRYLLLYTVKTYFQYCIEYYLNKDVRIKWLDKVF